MKDITAPVQRYAPSPDVLCRVLDGEAVLLDLASGKYFGLNRVGTRIWELIAEGRAYAELRAVLLQEFEVQGEALDSDLAGLVAELSERGLIRAE
jgi:hypothetical protein